MTDTIRIARREQGDAIPSPRRLATAITGGAAVLALVLATALPAQADRRGDDLAKALIAALVLGAIVHETRKDRSHPAPAPAPEPVRKPRVPEVCAIQIEGEHRAVTVYPESCLRDEGFRYALPRNCAHEARIYGQWDRIYGVKCLRDAGFRVGGGREHSEH